MIEVKTIITLGLNKKKGLMRLENQQDLDQHSGYF